MTSRDDRFLEMLTDAQFDKAIELMLRGIVVEPELEPVARFVDEAGALADGPPPPRSPELAVLLAGQPLDDHTLSVGAARAAALARSCLPALGASGLSSAHGVRARVSARVAAMSLVAKAGIGLALAGAGAAGAGAAGVLPDPVVDAVRHAIEVVTPFELPDRASVEAATGPIVDAGSTTPATGSRPAASDGVEPPARKPIGSDASTERPPDASATSRPGGGARTTSPSLDSSPLVDPAEVVPALDDTPTPPASPPGHQQAPPGPAGSPSPGSPPSQAGDANPDAGGPPNGAGNPNPNPNAGDPPSQAANAKASGPPPGVTTASSGGPPSGKVADPNPGGPSPHHPFAASAGGRPPGPAGTAAPGRATPESASVPNPCAGRPPSGPPAVSSTGRRHLEPHTPRVGSSG